MVKALRSCLEAAKGKIKAGHLILRKAPREQLQDLLQPQIYPVYPFDMPDLQPATRSLDPQKKPQENSYRIFYSLKYIPYTHSTCRIYSLLVPGILESRMSQETAIYWQSPSLDPQKKPQENSYRIFYSLKYIPYTHSTCRIYSLLVPGILESRMSQETASYWQSPSSRDDSIECLSHARNNVSKDISYPSHQS